MLNESWAFFMFLLIQKQVINLLTKTYHLQKTVINSKFIIYIITTLSFVCNYMLTTTMKVALSKCRLQFTTCKDNKNKVFLQVKIL